MEGSNRKKAGLDAWAAGLFDGEGCIDLRLLSKGKHAYGLRLRMALKYPRPLLVLVGLYGGNVIPVRWSKDRMGWVWQLHKADDIDRALRAWLPWLTEKRPQVEIGLKFLGMVSRRKWKTVYSLTEQRRCAAWATRIKDLKRHRT